MLSDKKKLVVSIVSNPAQPDPRVNKEAETLVKSGYDVHVLCWDRENRFPSYIIIRGVKYIFIKSKGSYGKGLKSLFSFLKFWINVFFRLNSGEYDIIHSHDLDTLLPSFLAAKIKKKKLIYDAHEAYNEYERFHLKDLLTWIESFLSCNVDYVITVTDILENKFKSYGINNVDCIYNFPIKQNISIAARSDECRVFTFGRLGYGRNGNNLDVILNAFIRVADEIPNIRIIFAGKMLSNIFNMLQAIRISTKHSDKIIIFNDNIEYVELMKYYKVIDVSVIFDEASGNNYMGLDTKFFEATVYGIPTIVNKNSQTYKFIQKDNLGIVIENDTLDSLVDAMKQVVINADLYDLYRNNCISNSDKYLWTSQATRLLNIYEKIK